MVPRASFRLGLQLCYAQINTGCEQFHFYLMTCIVLLLVIKYYYIKYWSSTAMCYTTSCQLQRATHVLGGFRCKAFDWKDIYRFPFLLWRKTARLDNTRTSPTDRKEFETRD